MGKLLSHSQQAVASLVPWLEARAAVVKTFHANGWSMDVVKYLRALQHQSSGLTVVELRPRHMSEVTCLASFTALTSCGLHSSRHNYHDTVDLTTLQGLQMLTKLALNRGHYSSLSSMSHLTDLDLNMAHVSDLGYSTAASKLIHLRMQNSDLDNLRARGLMACIALQSLQISEGCTMSAVRRVDCLDTSASARVIMATCTAQISCMQSALVHVMAFIQQSCWYVRIKLINAR